MSHVRVIQCLLVLALSALLIFAVSGCAPAYADEIPQAAKSYQRTLIRTTHAFWGLDAPVATFAAQIHQESHWRADARSPVGAEGLAQFMPATSDWFAELYPSHLGERQPYNPGWAMRAMVLYDKWLHARIQAASPCEKWAMVLSAYNGGLGWVYRDKRLASSKGLDSLVWFDSVERVNAGRSTANWNENRGYPRKILLRWEPLYERAAWGNGVCGERP